MTTTPNLGLELVNFNNTPWHDDINNNFSILDAVLTASTGVAGLEGAWINSLVVTAGQKYVDTDNASIWQVSVAHTTAASGSFEDDRTAHPTYWNPVLGALNARGEWQSGIVYAAGDLAYTSDEALYCLCAITHTSGLSQRADIANWTVLLDGSDVVATDAVRYGAQTLTAGQKNQARDNIGATSAPLITRYTTAGGPYTHNFNSLTKSFKLIGGGGGGGGGGVGATSVSACGAGGSSGFVGESDIITRGAITSATINVGAKGLGGVATTTPVAGADGTDTTYTDGTNSFTWGKGKGGSAVTGTFAAGGIAGTKTGTLYGKSSTGQGTYTFNGSQGSGGRGGDAVYGTGGQEVKTNNAGNNAVGLAAGGGGASKAANTDIYNGGNGADGFLFVIEYF